MKNAIVDFLTEDQGLTMVEYAIAGALIAAGAVVAFTNLGTAVSSQISSLSSDVTYSG